MTDFLEAKVLQKLSLEPTNKLSRRLLDFLGRNHVTQSVAKNGDVLVEHINGCLLLCDRNEEAQIEVIKNRTFSPHIIAAVQSFIRPDTMFIDVGAHCGTISIPIAAKNPSTKVIAVEPQIDLIKRLKQNKSLNSLKNLRIEPIALAEETGELKLLLPKRDDGSIIQGLVGKISKKYLDSNLTRIVPKSTIDVLKISENMKQISVIKIDTQGFELDILRGAINVISKDRPALIIEIEDYIFKNPSSNRNALKIFLQNNNYEIFLLEKALPGRYMSADLESPMANDFLALPM